MGLVDDAAYLRAPHMNVLAPQYLAGHQDIRMTGRYVNRQQEQTLKTIARAREARIAFRLI